MEDAQGTDLKQVNILRRESRGAQRSNDSHSKEIKMKSRVDGIDPGVCVCVHEGDGCRERGRDLERGSWAISVSQFVEGFTSHIF